MAFAERKSGSNPQQPLLSLKDFLNDILALLWWLLKLLLKTFPVKELSTSIMKLKIIPMVLFKKNPEIVYYAL